MKAEDGRAVKSAQGWKLRRITLGVVMLAGMTLSCSRPSSEAPGGGAGQIVGISPAENAEMKVNGYTVVPPTACAGFFDSATPQSEQGAYNVAGWAWNSSARKLPGKVVIASSDGSVLATTAVTVERPDVKQNRPDVTALATGWTARVTAPAHVSLRGFALMDDGKSVCPLQNEFRQP